MTPSDPAVDKVRSLHDRWVNMIKMINRCNSIHAAGFKSCQNCGDHVLLENISGVQSV